jgi:hypothetical protein
LYKIGECAPLIMDGRDDKEPFAATRIITGADVDYIDLILACLSAQWIA